MILTGTKGAFWFYAFTLFIFAAYGAADHLTRYL